MEINHYHFRRYVKIIAIIVISIISIMGIRNENFAAQSQSTDGRFSVVTTSIESDLGDLNSYIDDTSGSSRITSMAGTIVSAIQIVGTIISVAVLIVIGIKYMMGSIEEKAEYKKSLIPYIIGAFLLFTGSLIPQLIYTISQNLNE